MTVASVYITHTLSITLFVSHQDNSYVEFTEEFPPISVAEAFVLADFDSEDTVDDLFDVVVTLVNAVDGGEYEGLLFDNTTEPNITISPPYHQENEFTISYTLEGSDNYSVYQNVSSD